MATASALGLATHPVIDPFGRGTRFDHPGPAFDFRAYPSPYPDAQRAPAPGGGLRAPPIHAYDDHSLLRPDRARRLDARSEPYAPDYRARPGVHRSPSHPSHRTGSEEPLYRVHSTPNPTTSPAPAQAIKPMHLPPSLNRQVLTRPLEGSMPAEFMALSPGQAVRRHGHGHGHEYAASSTAQSKAAEGAPGGEAMRREGSQSGTPAGAYGATGPGPVMDSPQSEKLPGIRSILSSRD